MRLSRIMDCNFYGGCLLKLPFQLDFKLGVFKFPAAHSEFKAMDNNHSYFPEEMSKRALWEKRLVGLIDYLFYLLYGVISLRIILEVAGAGEASGFKQFINTITYPFLNPSVGLFPDLVFREHNHLKTSYLVALCFYLMLHLAVWGLYRIFARRHS
jgi:hypothetical protein